jgi:hypothetical protein
MKSGLRGLGVILGFSFVAALPRTASGEELVTQVFTYTVQQGDTCTGIAERFYGNERYFYIINDYNPNAGSGNSRRRCNQSLEVGVTLRLPRQVPTAPDAEVTEVLRDVRSQQPQAADWQKARVGLDLFRGWRVSTLEESAAAVTFRDTSVVRLREDTLIIIYGTTARRARQESTKAVLERGALRSRLAELSGKAPTLEVETPSAVASLGPGEALVTVDEDQTSRVANHRGANATVADTRGRGAVRVRAGFGSKVRRGELPTPPRPLPPAPAWTEGEPGLFLSLADGQSSISGSWSPVEKAANYRVAISEQADGGGVAGSVGVPEGVNRFELRRFPAGTYYLTVAAIDGDRFEGPPSSPRQIRLVELELIQPGGAPLADGAHPRVLPGSRLVLPEGIRCAAAGGEARAGELLFDRSGTIALSCADESGLQTAALEVEVVPVALAIRGEGAGSGELDPLVRGEARTVVFEVSSALGALANTRLVASAGLTMENLRDLGEGRFSAVLTAASNQSEEPGEVSIDLVLAEGASEMVLARTSVATIAAPPAPPPPPGAPLPDLAELSALSVEPYGFGVRDEQRRGSAVYLGLAYIDGDEQTVGNSFLVTTGIRAELLHGGLRIDAAVALPPSLGMTWGGANLALSSRLYGGRVVGLALEVAAWLPFNLSLSDEDSWDARLVPSADLSIRIGRRFAFRTRQGATLDLVSEGTVLWSSAYAIDVRVAGPFTLMIESVLHLGRDGETSVVAPTMGGGFALELGPTVTTIGARYSLTDQASDLMGRYSVMATVRLAGDLWSRLRRPAPE